MTPAWRRSLAALLAVALAAGSAPPAAAAWIEAAPRPDAGPGPLVLPDLPSALAAPAPAEAAVAPFAPSAALGGGDAAAPGARPTADAQANAAAAPAAVPASVFDGAPAADEDEPLPPALASLQRAFSRPAAAPSPKAATAPAPKVDTGRLYSPDLIPARLYAFGHFGALRRHAAEVMTRLALPGDRPDYSLRFHANVFPFAKVWAEKGFLLLNLGVLALTGSEDELAAVLAQRMAASNPHQFKADADDAQRMRFLEQLDGYRDLPPLQREELRADLGGVERLAAAGYNPWAAYDYHKRMAKIHAKLKRKRLLRWIVSRLLTPTKSYLDDHPAPELRMAAIKGYILQRGLKEDTTDLVGNRKPLPLSLRLLRLRIRPFTAMALSPLFYWLSFLNSSYYALASLIGYLSPNTGMVLVEAREKTMSAWERALVETAVRARDFLGAHGFEGPMSWIGANVGGGSVAVAFLSLYPLGLGYLAARAYYLNRNYPILRRVRRERRSLRSPRRYSDDELRARLASGLERLADIETIYLDGDNAQKLYRYFDGLTWNRYRWPVLYRGLLEEQRHRLLAMPDDRRRQAELELGAFLRRRLPPFAAENAGLRDAWLALAAQAHAALPPEHATILAARAAALLRSGDADAILRLVPDLIKAKLYGSLRALYRRHDRSLFAAAVAPKDAGGPELANAWIDGDRALRQRCTLGKAGYFLSKLPRERNAVRRRLGRLFSPLDEKLAAAALLDRLPLESWRWVSLRRWLTAADRVLLLAQLVVSFRSMKDLASFIDARLRPRSVPTAAVRTLLMRAALLRSGWLGSASDLDALLATEEMWPQLGENRGGPMETLMIELIERNAKSLPGPWSYEPAASEALHALYLRRQAALGLAPRDLAGRVDLWRRLTERGVTAATDSEFERLRAEATGPLLDALEQDAVAGRVWDPSARAGIVERNLRLSPAYLGLLAARDPRKRFSLLRRVVAALQKDMPDRGVYYVDMIERLSNEIVSSPAESAYLQAQKLPVDQGGEKSEDSSLRVMSTLFSQALSWRRSQQWALILFLRGDAPPSRKIRRAFMTVGTERVKRFYDTLPLSARVGLLDTFVDSPKGLAGKVRARRGWSGVIVDHVLPRDKPEARRVAREMLESFLYALEKTGNTGFQSYLLAYMLALPKDQTSSVGKTLKGVLEIFGATGIKIGQFLAASGLLDENSTVELRELHERALPPEREQSYQDFRGIVGGRALPFGVRERLGAASIKYAHLAREKETGEEIVLKPFRLSAQAHTNQEFALLDHMTAFLQRRRGRRYGALRAIINAAKKAVARELSSANEATRSDIARRRIYAGRDTDSVSVVAPREVRLHERLIAAELARGVSLYDLEPSARSWAAAEVLSLETDVLFAPGADDALIDFDPDRHPGNYRFEAVGGRLYIRPIDAGQGVTITVADRRKIVSLIAVAQVMREAGATRWATEELGRILGLNAKALRRARRSLGRYFPDRGLAREAAYFTLLGGLDDAGVAVDPAYYDFVRGIVQFKQYQEFAPAQAKTPIAALTAAVVERGEEYRRTMTITRLETLAAGWDLLRDKALDRPSLGRAGQWLREPRNRRRIRAVATLGLLGWALASHPQVIRQGADLAWSRTSPVLSAVVDKLTPISWEEQFEQGYALVPAEEREKTLWTWIDKTPPGRAKITLRDFDPPPYYATLKLVHEAAAGTMRLDAGQIKKLAVTLDRYYVKVELVEPLVSVAKMAAAGGDPATALAALKTALTANDIEGRALAARRVEELATAGSINRPEAADLLVGAARRTKYAPEQIQLLDAAQRLRSP